MEKAESGLYDMNQNIGLSGNWRNRGSAREMDSAARDAQLGEEQLRSGFNNQVLGLRDQYMEGWVNPLYQSRMTNFYEAPWRNINTGGATPMTEPTMPQLQNFSASQLNPSAGVSPVATTPAPANGLYSGQRKGVLANPQGLFKQYMM
jgi:hypothetical protein